MECRVTTCQSIPRNAYFLHFTKRFFSNLSVCEQIVTVSLNEKQLSRSRILLNPSVHSYQRPVRINTTLNVSYIFSFTVLIYEYNIYKLVILLDIFIIYLPGSLLHGP